MTSFRMLSHFISVTRINYLTVKLSYTMVKRIYS